MPSAVPPMQDQGLCTHKINQIIFAGNTHEVLIKYVDIVLGVACMELISSLLNDLVVYLQYLLLLAE